MKPEYYGGWLIKRGIVVLFSCWLAVAGAQNTYKEIAQDTIVTLPGFLGNTYLLDGKKLNLQVMQWFMSDHPNAYSNIRAATLSDQLSVAGYTVGGVFLLSGFLVKDEDAALSRDLLLWGGIGIGSGLILQVVSLSYQKSAIRIYNDDIRRYYRKKEFSIYLEGSGEGVGVLVRF